MRSVDYRSPTSKLELLVRALVVLALAVDALIHFRLAGNFSLAVPGGIAGGTLFRLQAGAAILAGIFLAVRGSRGAYALAGLVLLSAFVAVMLYRYVDVPAIGPIPAMYEPIWYFEKSLSAVATGLGAVLAGAGLLLQRGRKPQ
ncbi:hypothetical protein K0651_10080 [Ornithinimicrobium sp. Arc0846-15]|nr:hypothetical protein [Ornithinimicrobium laminariae]